MTSRSGRRTTRFEPTESPATIWMLSDGSGGTCAHLVQAALWQFGSPNVPIVRHTGLRSRRAVAKLVRQAAKQRALVFHTLVAHDLHETLTKTAAECLVPTVDVLGPAVTGLTSLLQTAPRCQPELLYELERQHLTRIDAVDFTMAHDDGRNLATLSQADVVLVGVSRVSKSATCFVLACHGVRAANVPLIPDLIPPRELLALPPRKVVGLTASVARLHALRRNRVSRAQLGEVGNYLGDPEILAELQFATGWMERQKWPHIDVTFKAVEEVAREVLALTGP